MARHIAALLFAALLIWPAALFAEGDSGDRDFLTGFLEDSLSGAGRQVRIEGFEGALSSRATFERMTIADAQGVWLTISNGALSWRRTALLTGRVEIDEISADLVEMPRLPKGEEKPNVTAEPFALPELPVSVDIGKLDIARIDLGAGILGSAVTVKAQGSASLASGDGKADLTIERIDGSLGRFAFNGSFANQTREATIDLSAEEDPGGFAATLLGISGAPAAALTIKGSGPLSDFTSTLTLATDHVERLQGTLTLKEDRPADADKTAPAARRFVLDVAGDISPLLQPQYRPFFGDKISLQAEGARQPSGATDLTRLVMAAPGLDISGRLSLSSANEPLAAALTMRLGLPDQSEMLLPLPGAPSHVQSGVLRLRYDTSRGERWTLAGDLNGYRSDIVAVGTVALEGQGEITRGGAGGKGLSIGGDISFRGQGIAPADPRLVEAIGREASGRTRFTWVKGAPLVLEDLNVTAGDLQLAGNLSAQGQGLDMKVGGNLGLTAGNLARFSALAGRELGGEARAQLIGEAMLFSGAFDLQATVEGDDMTTGIAVADNLMRGQSRLEVSAHRDAKGITLDVLRLDGAGFALNAEGTATPQGVALDATLDATEIRTGVDALDLLMKGQSTASLTAVPDGAGYALTSAHFDGPRLTAALRDEAASGTWQVTARLADIGLFTSGISGPLTLAGTVAANGAAYDVDLAAKGPGSSDARLAGRIDPTSQSADLRVSGSIQGATVNRLIAPRSVDGRVSFDVALKGPLDVRSLSGRVSMSGLRLSSPDEQIALSFPSLAVDLGGGTARILANGKLQQGGTVSIQGPVTLAAPFDANLSVGLGKARIVVPNLLQAELDGTVTINGPLMGGAVIGGQITLADTEISVGSLSAGDRPLPDVRNLNESPASFESRRRAGLTDGGRNNKSGKSRSTVYGLDLTVSAPSRLFVRGLGLDAELGGTVHLAGTTADIVPDGRIELIRGRFDILGKRFKLTDGRINFYGDLMPYLNFVAAADAFAATTTIAIDGPATEPEIHFSSTTGVPEDEVISQLFFGNGFDKLSNFQLAQLANAIATLSGRSGDLIARIRNRMKLDDLDITSDDEGNASLSAGKYINDTLYSETSIDSQGKVKIELDLDVSKDLSVTGTVGSGGQTGAGIYYTHDY